MVPECEYKALQSSQSHGADHTSTYKTPTSQYCSWAGTRTSWSVSIWLIIATTDSCDRYQVRALNQLGIDR